MKIAKPRTFKGFPKNSVCPVCKTNEDAECVLLEIDGTTDGHICEGKPVHLWCAVAKNFKDIDGDALIYTMTRAD